MNQLRLREQKVTECRQSVVYGITVASVAMAWACRWLLDSALGDHLPYPTFFIAVAWASWMGGWRSGLLATFLGALCCLYSFIPPRYTIFNASGLHLLGFAMYIMVCCAIAGFGEALRKTLRRAVDAEANTRKQAEMLRTTLGSIGDAVITTDTAGLVTYLNPVAEGLTRWRLAEAHGRRLDEVFSVRDELTGHPVQFGVPDLVESSPSHDRGTHATLVRRDGTILLIDTTAAPIRDTEHYTIGTVLIFHDVTERRQDEMHLRESRHQLAAEVQAMNCLHDLVAQLLVCTDLHVALDEVLDSAMSLIGADMGNVQLLNTDTQMLEIVTQRGLCSEFLEYFQTMPVNRKRAWSQAMWRGEQVIIEDVQAHPDYVSHRDIATRAELRGVHSTPLMGRNGELLGVLTTFYRHPYHASERDKRILDLYTRQAADFIERLRSQAALQKSEAHYRAIGEAIDFGVWMCNADGRATYISDSFLRMVGMTSRDCLDLGWGGLLHPDEAEATMAAWKECVATGGVWDREHRFRGVDGQWHFVLARGVPVRADDGALVGWAGINLDIDRLKQAEEDLREADRRKDEFLATLAHELRNPLAPVRNAVQILQLKSEAQQELKWASDVIERQVQAMTRLIDDLMDVSRISRGRIELKREPVDLETIVMGALETSRPFIEQQRHDLTVRLPDKPVLLDADVTRLTQVILNLLNNAAKYTEPRGKISLEADLHGHDIVITVRDTGVGIREKDLSTVFQMFCQIESSLSRSQGGLGIGLCLVKRLVEMHGGSIEARSRGPGSGSEFIVRLPLARKCESCNSDQPESDGALSSRLRILVADDNRDAASSIALLLQLKGNNVRTAFDGQEAFEAAGEFRPDVVLMDIGMPRMNGYEAAQEIRRQPWGQQIVLIAVTGWGQEDDRRRSDEVGFDHHMVKPVDPVELMRLLTSLPAHLQAVP